MAINVLFINDNIPDYQNVVDSVNSTTLPIVYSCNSTRTEIIDILDKYNIKRIGFFNDSSSLTFLENEPFFDIDILDNISGNNYLFIISLINKYNIVNIDYLACNTLNNLNYKKYYNVLNTFCIVGASNNATGNIQYGGDWIMESTAEDIESIYFTSKIQYYKYLLVNIANQGTGFIYNNVDICNNFTSISSVTTPLYNGSTFLSKFETYISGTKYDLSQLYSINTTLDSAPVLSCFKTTYNSQIYDINSFLKVPLPSYVIGSGFTRATLNTTGHSLYYLSSTNGTTINNEVTSTITINSQTTLSVLLIGGGGYGGITTTNNGAGQGGNAIYSNLTLTPGTYTITITNGTSANATYGQGGSNISFSSSNGTFSFNAPGGSGGQNGHNPGYNANPSNGLTTPATSLSGANSYFYAKGSNGQSANSYAQSGYVIVPNNATMNANVTKTTNAWYYNSTYSLGETVPGTYVTYTNYYNISHELVQDYYYYLPIDSNMFNDISNNCKTYNTYYQLGFGSGGTDSNNYPGYSDTSGFVYAGSRGPSPPTSANAFKAYGTNCYSIGCGGFGPNQLANMPTGGPPGGPSIMYLYI